MNEESERLSIEDGWLPQAVRRSSPNYDARPSGCRPELLVVHGISLPPGEFGGPWIDKLFMNTLDWDVHPYFDRIRGARVSAHALIRRDGGLLQYVSFDNRAWHAGESNYCGRTGCNDFSIGVELEGADEIPYTSVQYARLVALARALMQAYPDITAERITGHSDISPGRKTDPGPAFDWAHMRNLLIAT